MLVLAAREHWHGLRQLVEHVRDRYGLARMAQFERIAARYGIFLFAKLEPLARRWDTGDLAGMTPDRLRILCSHIVSEGLNSYDGVMRDPNSVLVYRAQVTLHTGLYLHAIFRYEALLFQSHKFRLVEAADTRGTRVSLLESQNWFERLQQQLARALGSFDLLMFLETQFTTDEDVLDVPESLPRFKLLPSGEVKRVECTIAHARVSGPSGVEGTLGGYRSFNNFRTAVLSVRRARSLSCAVAHLKP